MKLSDNKVIWAYWDGPVNKIGKKCQESWKKYLPDCDRVEQKQYKRL